MSAVRRSCAALVGTALVVVLGGCAGEQERYCGTLEEKRETLEELSQRSAEEDVLDETVAVLRDLQEDAPGDLVDEWATLVNSYETFADALEAAGVDPTEYDPAAPPEDLTAEERERIEDAAEELRSPRVMSAADGVEQHARDVCKVDLGLSS